MIDFHSDILYDMTSMLMSEAAKHLDDQLLKALKDNGYKFRNMREIEEFAKTRCQVIVSQIPPKKVLRVDGKPIFEWWDIQRIEIEGNKVTYIYGESPNATNQTLTENE